MEDRYDVVYDEDRQEVVVKDIIDNKVMGDVEMCNLLNEYNALVNSLNELQGQLELDINNCLNRVKNTVNGGGL